VQADGIDDVCGGVGDIFLWSNDGGVRVSLTATFKLSVSVNLKIAASVKKVGVPARSGCSGAAGTRRNTYFFYRCGSSAKGTKTENNSRTVFLFLFLLFEQVYYVTKSNTEQKAGVLLLCA